MFLSILPSSLVLCEGSKVGWPCISSSIQNTINLPAETCCKKLERDLGPLVYRRPKFFKCCL